MPLKDLLKKKDKSKEDNATAKLPTLAPDVPEFTFLRTTTHTQETFEPPSFPGDPTRASEPFLSPKSAGFKGRFRRHSNAAQTSSGAGNSSTKSEHKIFGRSRSSSSVNVPQNLPEVGGDGVARNEEDEAKWEKRATMLVQSTNVLRSGPNTPNTEKGNPMSPQSARSRSGSVYSPPDDVRLREFMMICVLLG
jgi:hypothetical protein